MNKRLLLIIPLVVVVFVAGILVGINLVPEDTVIEKENPYSIGNIILNLQTDYQLAVLNHSMPVDTTLWATTQTFSLLLTIATDVLQLDIIYYGINEWQMPYFWFKQDNTYWRYDLKG